ncbi:MAG: GGDEF domain-containing phosphodiesterase [Clostridia bacterium]
MTDLKNEQWLRECFHDISPDKRVNYLLISLKIKRLRNVNRVFGHEVGNELIHKVYQIITDWLEPDEYAAQIYGGYYNLLIHHTALPQAIDYSDYSPVATPFAPKDEAIIVRTTLLSRAIRDMQDERFHGNVFVGMGIYNLPDASVDFDTARYNADLCRAESLESTYWNTHLEIYGVTFRDPTIELIDVRKRIIPAIESGCICPYLQPKVDLKTGEIIGAEALVRWIDPVRGMIPPNDFIPTLEMNGLIQKLDLYMFEQMCALIEKWRKSYGRTIPISVNLSKYYFNSVNFLSDYQNVFHKYQLLPSDLEFELLESIVFSDLNRLHTVVEGIRKCGFNCSLDDFGSGFSSYSALSNADLTTLKLDRSLFQNENNLREKTVIHHIIKVAHELGLRTVAEGVEAQSYVHFLREAECDAIQGFVFFRPMPVDQFEQRFLQNKERISLEALV